MATRSEISKKAWRTRKRRGGKGRCSFCGHAIYAGGVVYQGRKFHKSCLESFKAGLTRRQAGVSNPQRRTRDSYRFYGATALNPRPPAAWFAQMAARTAASYPRKAGESLKKWRASISTITAGIWWKFPEATRRRLIKKYEGMAVPARALNPRGRKGVEYLWVRQGDASDYEKRDGPYDAGYTLGTILGKGRVKARFTHKYGVEIEPGFTGYNYVSLFWGDDDAQPIRELTQVEKRSFTAGLKSGCSESNPKYKLMLGEPKRKFRIGQLVTLKNGKKAKVIGSAIYGYSKELGFRHARISYRLLPEGSRKTIYRYEDDLIG